MCRPASVSLAVVGLQVLRNRVSRVAPVVDAAVDRSVTLSAFQPVGVASEVPVLTYLADALPRLSVWTGAI